MKKKWDSIFEDWTDFYFLAGAPTFYKRGVLDSYF